MASIRELYQTFKEDLRSTTHNLFQKTKQGTFPISCYETSISLTKTRDNTKKWKLLPISLVNTDVKSLTILCNV